MFKAHGCHSNPDTPTLALPCMERPSGDILRFLKRTLTIIVRCVRPCSLAQVPGTPHQRDLFRPSISRPMHAPIRLSRKHPTSHRRTRLFGSPSLVHQYPSLLAAKRSPSRNPQRSPRFLPNQQWFDSCLCLVHQALSALRPTPHVRHHSNRKHPPIRLMCASVRGRLTLRHQYPVHSQRGSLRVPLHAHLFMPASVYLNQNS